LIIWKYYETHLSHQIIQEKELMHYVYSVNMDRARFFL